MEILMFITFSLSKLVEIFTIFVFQEVEKTEDSGKTDSFGSMMGSLDSKPKPKVMPTKNKNKDLLASLAGTPKVR